MAIEARNFTNAELNGDSQLEWNHGLNTSNLIPIWYDGDGVQQSTIGVFEVVDSNNIILSCNDTITGTHKLLLQYDTSTIAINGRRLFERTLADPNDTQRVAFGSAGNPTINTTWERVKELLTSGLDVLIKSNNLSDVEPTEGRNNLSVYSKAYINALADTIPELYEAASGAVVGVLNNTSWAITQAYNPVNKTYADNVLKIETPTFDDSDAYAEISDVSLTIKAIGNFNSTGTENGILMINGYAEFNAGAFVGTWHKIGQIVETKYRPSAELYFPSSYDAFAIEQSSSVKLDTDGELYMKFGSAFKQYFNAIVIL